MKFGRREKRILWSAVGSIAVIGAIAFAAVGPSLFSGPKERLPDEQVAGVTDVLERNAAGELPAMRLVDVTAASGVTFLHADGRERHALLPEDMGSGAAWGDVDGDGDPDLYLVNQSASCLAPDSPEGQNALYLNNGDGTFTDASSTCGAADAGFGMGAVFADFDADGDADLYVTNFGPNALYRNRGDGTFEDVTETSGVGDPRFSTGASWADFDGDGDLDLYVANYVDFVFTKTDRVLEAAQYGAGVPFTLNPSSYTPQSNSLYRNNADGTFTDVAEELGVADPAGRGMCVAFTDLDFDGDADLYVANDITTNALFLNDGEGKFVDWSGPSLAADYRGAMGLAVADYDRDSDLDIFITHWVAQENTLYRSLLSESEPGSRPRYTDVADLVGLGNIALRWVGWGTAFVDLDLDGWLDLPVANGSTLQDDATPPRLVPQSNALFWNRGDRGFYEVGANVAPALAEANVARGLAVADFDADGDPDLVVTRNRGSVLLLRNDLIGPPRGVTLRIEPALPGTRIEIETAEGRDLRVIGSGLSYLSSHHSDVIFGLGAAPRIERLTVRFPDGHRVVREAISPGRYLLRREPHEWHELSP